MVEQFLDYTLQQTHPLIQSWYTPDDIRDHWRADIERDASEFFTDEFAGSFARNCEILKVPAEHFRHRLLETSTRRMIAGIRFFGMDLNRPFIEVAQLSKPVGSDSDRDEITKLLRSEFSMFNPTRWHVYQSSHLAYQFALCEADKRYMVGKLQTINELPKPEGFERVRLEMATSLDWYTRYAAMYETLFSQRPWMPDISRQESLEDMQDYLSKGWLYEVFVDDTWAGVTAVSPGFEVGAKGHYMIEIVLDTPFRGHGLGVALQRKLASLLAAKSADEATALFGTIGAVNTPMLKTALRVGRVDVGGRYWVKF